MSLLTVDQEKCKQDRICMAVCPAKIIEFKTKEAFPTLIDGGEELCVRCGHCVAVCPHGAMSHAIMKSEICIPIKDEWLVGPDQMEHFLRARRSIRVYKKKEVERALLTRLINIARFAPSGHNTQPVNWLVIYDRDDVRKLSGFVVEWMRHLIKEESPLAATFPMDGIVAEWEDGIDRICRDAPHLIVAHSPENSPTAPQACTIALTYLELAAASCKLGACWAGFFSAAAKSWPPMQKALRLPDGHVSFGAMMMGYPKFKYHRLPLRNEAKITWV